MKTILIKSAFYIPVVFLLVYIFLMAIGGITCACSADAQLYCSTFCMVAKIVVGASILVIMGMMAKELHNEHKRSHSVQA